MFCARASSYSAIAALILTGIAPSGWSQVGNGARRIRTDPAAAGRQRLDRVQPW